ncbi:TetR/AcrR family transcriptional regulator [Paracoccus sp. (in: a-proteobacteria)]|uniref:TetR/AcrR family transcriptional regulator n=1 Tax=Paracoccus sp. TaxID=267 RepID=UPI00272DAF99|nr:TetR/AcrR family transcriptional regulator [Paracoccus sp. (in: a-proteobacteria)]
MSDQAAEAPVTPKAAYHHGDLRAQLIEAVRDLVETHGPDGFSVAEAARRAGVSSAAPYKHFKDRPDILRAVAGEGMDRLRVAMEQAAAAHPVGSLEAVAAIGLAYVDFARTEPGVFRLVFGLTEGHENAPDLQEKGECCFGVVVKAVADRLKRPTNDPLVQRRAYMLWSFVHGHSFLHIDGKTRVSAARIDDWLYLTEISKGVLATLPGA